MILDMLDEFISEGILSKIVIIKIIFLNAKVIKLIYLKIIIKTIYIMSLDLQISIDQNF